jgi:hypothetical protein
MGTGNSANGYQALLNITTGSNNIAIGNLAGENLATGSNNIDIGNTALAADTGIMRIGTTGTQKSTYIAGVSGSTASKGVAVYITPSGQLGTLTSSRRFKKDINDMAGVSDRLMQLRPVTFRYKQAAEDGTHPIEYGLIAEEVAKVYPDLVQYDKAGKPFTIYYHLLTPMLLNELQKQHRQAVAQRVALRAAQTRITILTAAQEAAQAETASLKAALQTQSSELASLKQAQQEQLKALARLCALVKVSQHTDQAYAAAYVAH